MFQILFSMISCANFSCITFLEFTLSVRHAQELFSQTEFVSIASWLGFMIAVCLAIVYLVVMWGSKVRILLGHILLIIFERTYHFKKLFLKFIFFKYYITNIYIFKVLYNKYIYFNYCIIIIFTFFSFFQ